MGKTTTAINLAAAFAQRGSRVLLLDMDPQGNSSLSFLTPATVDLSTYDMMVDGQAGWDGYIYPSPVQNLDIIPARINLAKLEAKLVGDFDAPFRLKDRLEPLRSKYDIIVIDTPPYARPDYRQRLGSGDARPHPHPIFILCVRGDG